MEAIIAASQICDKFGIDTMTAGVTIGFAMECFEKGLIIVMPRKFIVMFLLVGFVLVGCGSAHDRAMLKQAKDAMEQGNIKVAINNTKTVLRKSPKNFMARRMMGKPLLTYAVPSRARHIQSTGPLTSLVHSLLPSGPIASTSERAVPTRSDPSSAMATGPLIRPRTSCRHVVRPLRGLVPKIWLLGARRARVA